MIPDVLQMLRDANPVTEPVSYPDERVPTEIAQITEAGPERAPIAAGPGIDLAPRRRRWMAPILAAATVAAVAVTTTVLLTGHRNGSAGSPVGDVVCRVSDDGDRAATNARLA